VGESARGSFGGEGVLQIMQLVDGDAGMIRWDEVTSNLLFVFVMMEQCSTYTMPQQIANSGVEI
jgi:hypothetical protein